MSNQVHSRDHEILALMCACANVRYGVDRDLRTYHNYSHAIVVMDAVQEINPDAGLQLAIAALYHDAVYIPGAGTDANERCSAAALAVDWAKCRFHKQHPVLSAAQTLILGTPVKNHLTANRITTELGTLLDADLRSLATDRDEFLQNQANIILENGGEVGIVTLGLCANFLHQFLTVRSHIYHTDYAREMWEDQARSNIEWLCAEY